MSPADPVYIIRAARVSDLPAFLALRELAGTGFTSLMADDAALEKRLKSSVAAFLDPITAPGPERYLLMLEHRPTAAIVGTAAVKATVGMMPPFFNFRVVTTAQASLAAGRRFDMDLLVLVNEYAGSTEVGSLFVHPDHRAGGVGRALAQARYLLIAAAPHRFHPEVVSELRGVVDENGCSPFWDALGQHFFQMSFQDADKLSAITDNQFILDLMPRSPIYVDLLPQEARDVIGEAHAHGQGAKRLLEWEGFRFDHVIDIFDGGPLMSAGRDSIRTVRESRAVRVEAGRVSEGRRALLACNRVKDFACAPVRVELVGDAVVRATPETLSALGLEPGDTARLWMADAH
jgi:arginine N-succinyltransferase